MMGFQRLFAQEESRPLIDNDSFTSVYAEMRDKKKSQRRKKREATGERKTCIKNISKKKKEGSDGGEKNMH